MIHDPSCKFMLHDSTSMAQPFCNAGTRLLAILVPFGSVARPPSLSPYLPGVAQAYLSLFKTHQFLRFQIQKSTNHVMNPQPFTLTIVQDSTRPFSRRTSLKIQENFQPPSHSTQLPAECQGLLTSETQHNSCSGIIWYPIFLHPMDFWMYPDVSQCAQSQG